MSYFARVGAVAMAFACAIAILFIAAVSEGANFDKDWLLEELTCEELIAGYKFEIVALQDIVRLYNECRAEANKFDADPHIQLYCALLRKEGEFVQGKANDLADVYNAKTECGNKE